jgi:hypothetical protein
MLQTLFKGTLHSPLKLAIACQHLQLSFDQQKL